ncbi:hypothetical protein J437_LFUL014254 [Ladona fulva]|uniref:Pellino FHA domain-containing protein n=1 Tax=Ladona fulva TaxID=123851 RepID=A0A8K0KHC9_LADFU|nr:hypothetical protein J437_LFUL014254 [Ladona fulva]
MKCLQAILDTTQHSISYTLSRNQAMIVEYMPDEDTDMFQIGRSSESPIDFVVVDTVAGGGDEKGGGGRVMQSTISRFACRILAERKDPRVARIYAAGFDSSRNIFLGKCLYLVIFKFLKEKATKWQTSRGMDGLTTNGVLIMHPRGAFSGAEPPTCPPPPLVSAEEEGERGPPEWGVWREVSVGGGVFTLRESRSAQQKGLMVEGETNILLDGTLIDLCGATLLWRSAEGLAKSPPKKLFNMFKIYREIALQKSLSCQISGNALIPREKDMNLQ